MTNQNNILDWYNVQERRKISADGYNVKCPIILLFNLPSF